MRPPRLYFLCKKTCAKILDALKSVIIRSQFNLFGVFFSYRVFDDRLDSLTTPELDELKESNSEAADKKLALPLDTFKRQLHRLYLLTEGLPKNPGVCKSRSIPVNQVRVHLFF